MILLKSVKLKNFLSHSETKIDFQFSERLLIDGKSGAGKSAIIDALVWGLYNVGRVQNRSLIKRQTKEAEVTIELADGPIDNKTSFAQPYVFTKYVITRKITDKGTHSITVTQDDIAIPVSGTKNIQEFIEKQILKCSYPLFINSVCYPQENLESFVRQTPAKRKDLLLELVHAEDYDGYHNKARELISTLNGKMAIFGGQQQRLNDDLAQAEKAAILYDQYDKKVLRINAEIKKVNEKLETVRTKETENATLAERLTATKREYAETLKQSEEIYKSIDDLILKIKSLRGLNEVEIKSKLARLEVVSNEATLLQDKVKSLYAWKDEYTAIQITKPQDIAYKAHIDQIQRQLKLLRARTIEDEVCVSCGVKHRCTLIESEIKGQIGTLEAQLLMIGEEQRFHQGKLDDYQSKLTALIARKPEVNQDKLIALNEEIKQLDPFLKQSFILISREESIKEYNEEISKLKAKLTTLNSDLILSKIKKIESTISNESQSVKTALLREQQERQTELWSAAEQLALAKQAKSRIPMLKAEVEKHNSEGQDYQEKLDNLLILKEAFGTNGIKSIVIDYVLPQLEQRINTVLQPLSDFKIKLDTQRSNVSGENMVEGLFISVMNDHGEEFDYDSYSGGQKIKILFAITEGLAQMQKIGFRILDEAVVGLDEESGDQFATAILAFQERFQQLICISHLPQIKDLFETKIMVKNSNGTSIVDK